MSVAYAAKLKANFKCNISANTFTHSLLPLSKFMGRHNVSFLDRQLFVLFNMFIAYAAKLKANLKWALSANTFTRSLLASEKPRAVPTLCKALEREGIEERVTSFCFNVLKLRDLSYKSVARQEGRERAVKNAEKVRSVV